MWKSFLQPAHLSAHNRRLIYIRPIFWIPLSFMLGIWFSEVLSPPFFLTLFFGFIVLCISMFYIRRTFFFVSGFLVFFLVGMLFGIESRTLSKNDIAQNAVQGFAVLQGKVVSFPEVAVKGRKETVSFVLEAEDFFRKGRVFKTNGKVQVFLHNVGRQIQFGDRLRLKGNFELPKEIRNPHVFDYAAYLSQNGIHKTFRGIGSYAVLRQERSRSCDVFSLFHRLRMFLREKLERLFSSPHRELAGALLLGFKKSIPREIKDAYVRTNTAHLLVISGFNITLVGGFFYFLVSSLGLPQSAKIIMTVFFILGYTVLAGADPPVLRAGMMGTVVLLGFLLEQERHIKSALFLAFFLLLVFDPKLLFLASFQLSFVATASLIFILPVLEKNLFSSKRLKRIYPLAQRNWWLRFSHSILQTLVASLAVTVGMFPVLIWYFNQFSSTIFLANAIVIPIYTLGIVAVLMVLAVDLTGLPIAHFLAWIPKCLFDLQLGIVRWFSEIPFGYFYFPKPGLVFFVFYYGFLAVWLLIPKFRRISLFCLFLTTIIFFMGSRPVRSNLLFFDLGKTDAAFISFSNGARFLINTGRHFPSDQAYWILRSYLMASGIRNLDGLLFTGIDAAHAGGFKTLARHFRIGDVWVPLGFDPIKQNRYVPVLSKRLKPKILTEGDRIQMGSDGEIYLEVLVLDSGRINALLISDGAYKVLYISSAKEETFRVLLSKEFVECDVVFLPHHESGVSEAEKRFFKALSARYLVLNQRDELAQLRAEIVSLVNVPLLSIQEVGAVEFSFQKDMVYRTFLKGSSEERLTVY